MAISKQQSMRPAEIELIDASNQHESTLQSHAQSLETLDENLSTETTDRETADTALGTRIDNEVQSRTDADTALGTRIDGESQARTDADTALGTRIDDEVQARTDADTALGTRIDGESQARTDADTALGTRIDDEVQARTDGDATLQSQIDALVAVGAEPNVIDSISVNGVAQTVTDKNVDIDVPTSVTQLNGTLPIANGGTGATDAATARTNLGAASQADFTALTDTISCVATQSDIALVAYTSPSKDNGLQVKYNISAGKYYVVAKYNGTWQTQKEI